MCEQNGAQSQERSATIEAYSSNYKTRRHYNAPRLPHNCSGCARSYRRAGKLRAVTKRVVCDPTHAKNGGTSRLAETFTGPVAALAQMGPLCQRTLMGQRARRLQSLTADAWEFLTHDMARSKAYRWGEDGIAGICDRYQLLVFALALWNGRDPILKERMFGLSGNEGNHGEDAKEYWFYLDNTPTHSYMRMLYKYPQRRVSLPEVAGGKSTPLGPGSAPEYELLDTGIFDEDRYFDIFIEYAKAGHRKISAFASKRSTAAPKRPSCT